MKIAIAQINPIVADIDGNRNKIISYIENAEKDGAELIIFPEMATIGYPPLDLLDNKKLIEDNLKSLDIIAEKSNNIAVICGYVDFDENNASMLYNSAAFLYNGEIKAKQFKTLLPTYDVFDEMRYFSSTTNHEPIKFKDHLIGLTICEDIWNIYALTEKKFMENKKYNLDPVEILAEKKSDIIINISASPFVRGKFNSKRDMLRDIAKKHSISIIYANQVGGNDELIFDGRSLAINPKGSVLSEAKAYEEDLLIVDTNSQHEISVEIDEIEEIREALKLGIKDYVRKCGFKDVVIGLSGGIDSALTATLAAEALGPENVLGITMPSKFSSKGSVDDSYKLAKNLGIKIETISIKNLYKQFNKDLKLMFKGLPLDVTEENIQARVRGTLLMAVSNKTGRLLLSTGNKSELAMGYCTLYGDMSGGLAVISDLPKTIVYKLSEFINSEKEKIPWETISKPPSAELREDQKDEDSLPPYDILDGILELYIEERKSSEEIIAKGFSEDIVNEVLKTVNRNEYKRRQAAPGLKVTAKAFGIGRRVPIAQKFVP